ncbi:hypothetical protein V2J09_022302 [Rumex salicifolius]
MSQSTIPIMSSRLDQIEAAVVDTEMAAMLKEKLINMFSVLKPGKIFQYEAELDAVIEFLIWRFSIWVDKPTPGNSLMNLPFQDERGDQIQRKTSVDGPGLTVSQKLWYCIATVGAQYIFIRSQSLFAFARWDDLEQRSWRQYAWLCLRCIVGIYKAASFFNLLVFLYTGKYRNLVERILRVRVVYGSPDMNFCPSMDILSNWNEDMQMLLLPLLDSPLIRDLSFSLSKGQTADSAGKQTLCPICKSHPTTSFVALPCRHRYCYYCLQTRSSDAPSFRCIECSEPVTAIRRDNGSVDATTSTL